MLRTAAAALALCVVPTAAAGSSPTGAQEPGAAPEAQVVGGRQATLGRWDDAVGVYFQGTSWPSCTGTLIAPTVVLTAGHCIGGVSSVQLGVNDFTMPGGETIDVVQEIEYPDSQSTFDVGILILAQPSAYTPRV